MTRQMSADWTRRLGRGRSAAAVPSIRLRLAGADSVLPTVLLLVARSGWLGWAVL
jgi:hypothetical protein